MLSFWYVIFQSKELHYVDLENSSPLYTSKLGSGIFNLDLFLLGLAKNLSRAPGDMVEELEEYISAHSVILRLGIEI